VNRAARVALILFMLAGAVLAGCSASAAGRPGGGLRARQEADARVLIRALTAYEVQLKAPDEYQASPILHAAGQTWLVLAGADGPDNDNPSVTATPYPDGTLQVYRWSDLGWHKQGVVSGWIGPISGCCGISPAFLTGSRHPDFTISGGGAADTNWFAVVSDAGGHWHLVPFDYGYTDSTIVNGGPYGDGVRTEVDATSAAQGPTTGLFETYQDGAFRPADPPGPQALCSRLALDRAAHAEFTRAECADGWAIAVGARVGLFDANGARWHLVELDSGASLGCDAGIYDIPLSLLRLLAARLGPVLQPELATAPLVATEAMIGWSYVAGVIGVDGAQWFIAENPTGHAGDPGATATVYRWSGSAWLRQGIVDHVPVSLNYYDLTGPYPLAFGHFETVTVPGAADPGFILQDTTSRHRYMFTNAGGRWHAAPYRS
jgi:hypothetical protein